MTEKNLKILLVDDETATVISVAFVLRHCGYTVDAVRDGADALARLRESPQQYHILITDHSMQNVSGLELLQNLRQTAFRGRIVVLSSNLTRELVEAYTGLGADRLISKPFDLVELRQAISELGTGMEIGAIEKDVADGAGPPDENPTVGKA